MDKRMLVGGGLALAAGLAIGINVWGSHSQATRDKAALVAQGGVHVGPGGPGGRGPRGPGGPDFQQQLGLSDSQKKAFDAAQKEMFEQMDKLRASGASRDDARKIMDAQRQKMDAVLTADQREKMQQLMASRGPGGPGGPGGFGPPPDGMPPMDGPGGPR